MRTKLVVYAEGRGETAGELRLRAAPGDPLPEDSLGAAHILVRRCVCAVHGAPSEAITFVQGLFVDRSGRVPVGSDIYGKKTAFQKLLTFANPRIRPDGIVVLVDEDGDRQRLRTLREWASGHGTTVIAVARPEFEAWLVASTETAREALGKSIPTPPDPEAHEPGGAKALFGVWTAGHEDPGVVRRRIAALCDLELLSARCPSFADLCEELRRLPIR